MLLLIEDIILNNCIEFFSLFLVSLVASFEQNAKTKHNTLIHVSYHYLAFRLKGNGFGGILF